MSDRKQANIDRINDLWKLHEPEYKSLGTEGRCLAFVIDRRYVDNEGVENRLGISFGNPVIGPETRQGFLPIPARPGKFVFGLHHIGTKGDQLSLYDRWMDARDAGGCTDPVEAEGKARAILDQMSDEDYQRRVEALNVQGPLKVSSTYLLEDFEVVKRGAW